ncbi:hypothetical protein WN944_006888 [Citrus x changshan-huyou]|uniref:Uncharacterized protein n=1 Tax=Citrus x changshan-huyou TaxID=2935761 RepID=A0AAP0QPZ9_9ROSI
MAKAISNNYVSNNSKKMSSSVATAAEAEHHPFLSSPASPPPSHHHVVMHGQMLQGLRNLLSTREPETRPVCAVIDVMMGWTADACIQDVKPGEARLLPGLPKDTALFGSNLKYRPHGPLSRGPPPLRGATGSEKMGPSNPVINHTR